MKIIATSDLHQYNNKWKQFVKVCIHKKAEIAIVSGDLFIKDRSISEQFSFLPKIKKYASKLKENNIKLILILGNDDNQNLIYEFEKEDQNLWHFVHNKKVIINKFEFIGMPYVLDYPFRYKFWCHPENKNKLNICSSQLGIPLILNKNNEWQNIYNLREYFQNKITIEEQLNILVKKIKNLSKSIWLIHEPPSSCELDVTAQGLKVGSDTVLNFIQKHQPLLTIHGHIHESPFYGGKWYAKIGNTLAIQAGQISANLYYCEIEIKEDKILKFEHSILKK